MTPPSGSAARARLARAARRHGLAIALIASVWLGGLALRCVGIRHGEPDLVWHPDVAKQTAVARHIYHRGMSIREAFNDEIERTLYPYGMSALLGRGWRWYAALSGDEHVDAVHRWVWALRMRHLATGLLLCATLPALLLAVGRRYTPWLLAAAGALLWWEPLSAQLSHYGMNDVPLAALLLLAWALSTRMRFESARWPWASAACGAVLGLAFGVKYQALLGLVFPAAAWAGGVRGKGPRWAAMSVAAFGVAGLAGVLFSCPLLVTDPVFFVQSFPAFMAWQGDILGDAVPLLPKTWRNLRGLLAELGPGGLGLVVMGFAGAVLWLVPREEETDGPGRAGAAGLLVFCCVLAAAVVVGRDFVRANDLLPLYAFAAVAAPEVLLRARGEGRRPVRLALAAVTVALILSFGATAMLDSLALARPDTRVRAQAWCRTHLEPGAVVLRERYTLPIGREDLEERSYRYLSSEGARGRVDYGDFGYAVASSFAYARFFDPLSGYFDPEVASFYQALQNHPVAARFADRELLFAHPTVTVYTP